MLRVGFVGLGAISHEHVLGYLDNPDAEIVAICCPDKRAVQAWLSRSKLPRAVHYASLEEMLLIERLDIVEILTPTHLHARHAIACANANVRGISLQKPMGLTLKECDDIIGECRRNGTILKVFENYLFYPVYVKVKELIDNGAIGEVLSVRLHTVGGLRDGAAWPWCWDPQSWRLNPKTGGIGPLTGDDGHHKFALARWFVGRDFEKVNSWIEETTPLDAPAFIRAKYRSLPGDSPKYAEIDVSFSTKLEIPWEFWLDDFVEIVGTKGILWLNQCQGGGDREFFKGNPMSTSPLFPPIVSFVNGKVESYPVPDEERNWSLSFVNSTKHFVKVMQGRDLPRCSGEEGKEILRCILASLVSAQEKRDVYMEEITTEAESLKRFEIRTIFCNPKADNECAAVSLRTLSAEH